MKYFNSTKVADSRKKIRAPFTTGYEKPEMKRSYHQQKWEDVERECNKSGERFAKEMLLDKIQYGDSYYNRYYRW